MARFEIEGPNGQRFEVEAPSAEAAAQAVSDMLSQQQAQQPSVMQDVGMGAASGLTRGVAGVMDLPNAALELGQNIGTWANQRITGQAPEQGDPSDIASVMRRVSPLMGVMLGAPAGTQAAESLGLGGMLSYEPQTTAGEFAQTAGEMAPGALVTPGGIIGRTMYGVVAPTIGAELGGRGVEALGGGETGQMVGRIAGSVLGPSLLGGAQRLVSPHGGVSPQRLERAGLLERQGVPLRSGQVVGSPDLQMLEESLTASPDQLRQFTSAVVRSFGGQAGDDIGAVLRAQQSRIGNMFDDVTSRLRVDPTSTSPANNPSEIVTRLEDIATEWGRGVQSGARIGLIDDFVQYFDDAISGGRQITPQELMRFRSQLSRTAATTQDAATQQASVALLRELDGVIDGSLMNAGAADAIPLLNTARQQWRDFLAFETAATRAGEAGLENTISPQALSQALRQQGGTQYVAGERGLFGDLARSGEQILRTAPAVSAGGIRSIPEVASGQTAETMATIGGGGGPSAILAFLSRMGRPMQRAAAQDPLGQMYLRNQLLGAPEYLPFSGRVSTYSPLAALGAPTGQQ
jgi:hypothetical protein